MSLYEIIRLIPDLNLCIFTQITEFPYLGRLYSCIKSNKTHISKFVIYDEKYDSNSGKIFGILRESNLIMGTTTNKDDAGHIIICDNGINFSVQCECYKIYDCFGPNTAFMVTTKLGNIFTVESKYHFDPLALYSLRGRFAPLRSPGLRLNPIYIDHITTPNT
jgi:hypothetical protein